jgi:VanZ family protein
MNFRSARLAIRIVFVLYALTLATGTHWPGLVISVHSFNYADKVVHFTAFLLWTVLLGLTGWFRVKGSTRRQLLTIGMIAGLYAAVDELTQGLPGVMRTVSASDLAANWIGITTGVWILTIIGRLRDKPSL